MTVYAVGQIKIKNAEEYDLYASKFLDVLNKFKGKLLAADFKAKAFEGEWHGDRFVIVEFPDKRAFLEWSTSDAYQAIAKHRIAGADATIILVNGIEASQ